MSASPRAVDLCQALLAWRSRPPSELELLSEAFARAAEDMARERQYQYELVLYLYRWTPIGHWAESPSWETLRLSWRAGVQTQSFLDRLRAEARLTEGTREPQIPIVDTPIEPMAPCALTAA